jgi:hypothetical protein
MTKFEIKVILLSISLSCVLSALFGFAGSSIVGTFWAWFWIAMLSLFVLFALGNSFLLKRDELEVQQNEIEMLEKISKFTIKLACAYCQQANTLPIQLNQRNTFKCESCNQVNGVSMQFMATTLTTPVQSVKLPVDESNSVEIKVV